ncbi:MAG TPA: hypothetical protein VGP70_19725 [Actinomadura sp.]|jgi:hypothetical protein|nr:hypothetical protein [Actinomadura sp.]
MTLATKLRDNKAVHAGAGAVDLAVEKLREVPVRVNRLQDTAKENASRLQENIQENIKELQDKVETKDLPSAAVAYATQLGTRVVEVIDELAERGRTLVNRVEADVPEISEPKPGTAAADAVRAAADTGRAAADTGAVAGAAAAETGAAAGAAAAETGAVAAETVRAAADTGRAAAGSARARAATAKKAAQSAAKKVGD